LFPPLAVHPQSEGGEILSILLATRPQDRGRHLPGFPAGGVEVEEIDRGFSGSTIRSRHVDRCQLKTERTYRALINQGFDVAEDVLMFLFHEFRNLTGRHLLAHYSNLEVARGPAGSPWRELFFFRR
jgi:hypothetical protein